MELTNLDVLSVGPHADALGAGLGGRLCVHCLNVCEESKAVGVGAGCDEGGELVVVAEDAHGVELMAPCHHVVLVDDGDGAQRGQPVERVRQVAVALAGQKVALRDQHLRPADAHPLEHHVVCARPKAGGEEGK